MTGVPVSLSPLLNVREGRRAIMFYQRAFGAIERFRVEDESGKVVATLAVGGMEFWVADESPEHQNPAPATLDGTTVRMILITDDPDTLFAQALAAGGQTIWPVSDQHGWRIGRLVDPFGHHWEISSPPTQGS